MTTYALFKGSLDPVVFLLILIAIGFFLSFRSGKKQSERIVLLVTFLVLYMASIFPVSNALCYILEKDYLLKKSANVGKLDIVIVLGGGASDNKYLEDTVPSYQTTSRIFYAVQLFRKSRAKYLVCAGKGDSKLSEAEVMRIAAEKLGVPGDTIKIDAKSRNTREHAEELNKMFDRKNLRIGLVTSAYHMKRSERELRKYFSDIVPLPSDYLYSSLPLSVFTFLPRTVNLYNSSIAVHESIGIAWYKI